MRIGAYVMLGDPSFLRESIGAYYGLVDRIVVSYDEDARSWTGTPLPIAQCLDIVRALDAAGKCVERPGRFWNHSAEPMENDTHQRQAALDACGDDLDWVLQLDTDEVMANPSTFVRSLENAGGAGAEAVDFPARWLYTRSSPGRYLESSDRWWRRAASYPGPLAVRPGVRLRHARQTDAALWRVDWRARNTDPWHPRDACVDEVIAYRDAVLHFSWVRDDQVMRRKLGWSGHAEHLADPRIYRSWAFATRHPWLRTMTTPLRSERWVRPTAIPEPPGGPPIP